MDDSSCRYFFRVDDVSVAPFSWGSHEVNKMIGAVGMMVALFLYAAYSSDG